MEHQHFADSLFWRWGEGVNGREHPVFVLSSASTDKWMGEKTAVTLQLFLVCLHICERWICRTVWTALVFSGQADQMHSSEPHWHLWYLEKTPGLSPKQISERCFFWAQCWSHWSPWVQPEVQPCPGSSVPLLCGASALRY